MKKFKYFILTLLLIVSCGKEEPIPPRPTYTVTITADTGGSVSTTGGSYLEGTSFDVSATADLGYTFNGWSDGETSSNRTIVVSGDISLTARFIRLKYELDVTVIGEGTVREEIVPSNSTEYDSGTSIKLTPIPADGWRFSNWTGGINSADNPLTIQLNDNLSITANFEIIDTENLIELKSYIFQAAFATDGIWPPGAAEGLGLSRTMNNIAMERNNLNISTISSPGELYSEMETLANEMNSLIAEELELLQVTLTIGQEIVDNQNLESIEQFDNYQLRIEDASVLHSELMGKRGELIELSGLAPTIPGINLETVNGFIGSSVGDINGLTNDAGAAMRYQLEMIPQLLQNFDIENSEELQGAFDEYRQAEGDVVSILSIPRDELLFNQIYTNGYDVILEEIGEVPFEQLSFEDRLEKFQLHVDITTAEVERFRGFYEEALTIDNNLDTYADQLNYNSVKNYIITKSNAERISPEAGYRYSVQNAWRRWTLFRYTEAKYFLWFENEKRPWEQNGRTALGAEDILDKIIAIKAENDRLAPDFPAVELNPTGVSWPGYDSVFIPLFFRGGRLQEFQENYDDIVQYVGEDWHSSGGSGHHSGGGSTSDGGHHSGGGSSNSDGGNG